MQTIKCEKSTQGSLSEDLQLLTTEACDSLKKQKTCASNILLILEAIFDERYGTHTQFRITSPLPSPTNDPTQLLLTAKQSLRKIFSSNEQYTKCSIVLFDLIPEHDFGHIDCLLADNQYAA